MLKQMTRVIGLALASSRAQATAAVAPLLAKSVDRYTLLDDESEGIWRINFPAEPS